MAKTIMLVDDSLTLRQMLSITLKREGYEILEASGGKEALQRCRGKNVDLFICDLIMPEMNGIDFLKKLKEDQSHRFKPVIMLTTEPEDSIKEDARELGVKVWKVKPYDPVDITSSVRRLIRPEAV